MRLQFSRALTQSVAVRLRSRVVSFDTTYGQQDLEISELLFKKQGLITSVSFDKVCVCMSSCPLVMQLLLRDNLDVLVVIFF